jgi:hypothetical protein
MYDIGKKQPVWCQTKESEFFMGNGEVPQSGVIKYVSTAVM